MNNWSDLWAGLRSHVDDARYREARAVNSVHRASERGRHHIR